MLASKYRGTAVGGSYYCLWDNSSKFNHWGSRTWQFLCVKRSKENSSKTQRIWCWESRNACTEEKTHKDKDWRSHEGVYIIYKAIYTNSYRNFPWLYIPCSYLLHKFILQVSIIYQIAAWIAGIVYSHAQHQLNGPVILQKLRIILPLCCFCPGQFAKCGCDIRCRVCTSNNLLIADQAFKHQRANFRCSQI
jgi:hypothetical protein